MSRASARATLVGVVDALALVLLRPHLGDLARDVSSPGARLASIGSDRVLAEVVGAALWLLAAWVAVGLLALLGARLPGALGRFARRIGRVAVPRAVAGLLAGSAGLGVLLAPVAAGAVPSPVWPSAPAPQSSSSHLPALTWPGRAAPRTSPAASGGSTPSATSTPPASKAPSSTPLVSTPPASKPSASKPSASEPPLPAQDPSPVTPPISPSTPSTVAAKQVQPGDSLWLLAARRLGTEATTAQIAGYWPEVYAANRAVIGGDPSLIIPGQRLIEPAPTAQETTP